MSHFTFGCWLFLAWYMGAAFGSKWIKSHSSSANQAEGSADQLAHQFAEEMVDNLRRNVAEDKSRRAAQPVGTAKPDSEKEGEL